MVEEPTIVLVLHLCLQNVAVSKSRHRLLFYPTKERVKRTEKDLFENFLSKGGRLWKGKVLAPFPSVVFYGLLDASSCFKNCLCFVCFEKFFVLLHFNPFFCLQECYEVVLKTLFEKWGVKICLSKYLTVIYLLEKDCSFSFRQCYHIIKE